MTKQFEKIVRCDSCRTPADVYSHHGSPAFNHAYLIIASGRVLKDRRGEALRDAADRNQPQ